MRLRRCEQCKREVDEDGPRIEVTSLAGFAPTMRSGPDREFDFCDWRCVGVYATSHAPIE